MTNKILILLYTFILSFSSFLFAGAPDTLWTRTYGDTLDDMGSSVQQTQNGGFIISGGTESFGDTLNDIYIIQTDPSGDTLWTKTYGGTKTEWGSSVQQTSDGGFICAGYTESFGSGYADVYLIRTDSIGDTLWTKIYGFTTGNEYGTSVQQTSDGGYIIASKGSYHLIRTDSKGDTLWAKKYRGEGCNSVQQTTDGGFITAGTIETINDNKSANVIRTNSNGDTLWIKTYGGANNDYGYSAQQTSDGGFIIAGRTESFGAGNYDVYLICTNSNGDTLWTKTFGGAGYDVGYSVDQTKDGGFIIGGGTQSSGAGERDVYVIRTDSNGDTLWTKTIGGTRDDEGMSVRQTNEGGFIIAGWTTSFGAGNQDIYLIRLDKDTTAIQQEIPSNFLNPNNFIVSYNNNNLISIRYTIQHSSSVNLSMYNISGQLVKTLFNEYKNAGDYTINFNTDNISAGVYYFKLTAGESSYTRKAVVVE